VSEGRILIVEDSPSTASLINDVVTKAGYDTRLAEDGEKALELLDGSIPDIILLDVVLPYMDGLAVCKRIRLHPANATTKVIIVSSKNSQEDCLLGYKAGADDYLFKPFSSPQLIAKIAVFMRIKKTEDLLRDSNLKLNKKVSHVKSLVYLNEPLALLGKNAIQLVHNLNNPLQVMQAGVEMLKEEYDKQILSMLEDAVGQMDVIICSILSMGVRRINCEFTDVDLNEVIHSQLQFMMMDPFFKNSVKVNFLQGELPPVHGLRVHFTQVIGNLLRNAIDAIRSQGEGTLSIETIASKELIELSIADNGPGIRSEELKLIFEPFYTTKKSKKRESSGSGSGSGLGLSSSREIIESYNGSISVASDRGRGSVFYIILPVKLEDISNLDNLQETERMKP